jgi:hypothetical protein
MDKQSISRMTAEASFDKVRKQEQITRAGTEREERGAAVDANTVRLRELRLDKERTDKERPSSSRQPRDENLDRRSLPDQPRPPHSPGHMAAATPDIQARGPITLPSHSRGAQ